MERVVAPRFVHELPDLQLADSYRIVALGVAAMHERLHVDCPGRLGIRARERLDRGRRTRRRHSRRGARADPDRGEPFPLGFALPPVVRKRFDLDPLVLVEGADRQFDALARCD